jgi:hypothetical protein
MEKKMAITIKKATPSTGLPSDTRVSNIYPPKIERKEA